MSNLRSQEQHTKHGIHSWHKWAVGTSVILWLSATALPVWETQSEDYGKWETVTGIVPAIFGWLGIFTLCPAWFANIGLISLCRQLWKREEDFTFCFIICCIAGTAYMMPALYDDAGANIIMARYIGFYLWLISFLVILIGHAILVSQSKKRLTYTHWIFVLALFAAILPLEIKFPVAGGPLEHALKNPNDIAALDEALARNPTTSDKDAALWSVIRRSYS